MNKFGEKEMLDDILGDEKEIIKLYSTGMTESTCPNMRQVLLKNIQQANQDQFDVFDKMRTMGWYSTKPAETTEVDQVKQKFQQVQQQL
jgi:spore coat protein F